MLAPLDIFDPSSYPTRRNEEWKYSDLSRVLREAPHRESPVRSGHYRTNAWQAGCPAYQIFDGDYNTAFGLQKAMDAVVDNEYSSGVLELNHLHHGDKDSINGLQGSERVVLKPGAKLTIYETYSGSNAYAGNTELHFKLAEGASLTRIVILDEPEDAISIRRSTVETAPGSVFKQYVFSTGAKFQRFETHVDHAGHGAHVEMNGAYLLKDKRHFDLTTRVTHADVDGVTAQLIKGLVKDSATAVFQGRILVEKGAGGTDARMRHQALILNDGAHVRAKPELEIYADDVQCAHGNTIGALDEEALFFAMSRGIPEDAARAMLTHAFVLPVADLIEDEALRTAVLNFLTERAGYAL